MLRKYNISLEKRHCCCKARCGGPSKQTNKTESFAPDCDDWTTTMGSLYCTTPTAFLVRMTVVLLLATGVGGFAFPSLTTKSITTTAPVATFMLRQQRPTATLLFSTAAASGGEDITENKPLSVEKAKEEPEPAVLKAETSAPVKPKKKSYEDLRAEGGPLTFNTPIGALNPYAIYYGLTSIFLGIPWFFACKMCQFLYWITGNRFDRKRRIPVFLSHVWGITLLRLTRCYPSIKNLEILERFYSEKRPAMFVANHCSWMDIPFLGATIGWRNYKLISKKELGIVPILGTAIRAGGHIMVDRVDRRSQLATLKQGIGYLKDGIHLCTFPEGTRSRNGRVMKFKNGAFKMAHKAGAAVIPISIVNSHKVMPMGWMMAMRPAHGLAEVVVHEPVESVGRTEKELAEAVRESMIRGLPAGQVPL